MVSFQLDCFALEEKHTSEYLAKELLWIASEWNIEDKVAACITDGAANIIKAMGSKEAGGTGWPHAICFAHQLNLIVHNGIKSLETTVDKVKAIVQYFHKSTLAATELKRQQKNSECPELRLKQECPTRWNSTFTMLKRMLETREPGIITMALLNVDLPHLSLEEWGNMKTVCDILQPFDEVTVELSAERRLRKKRVHTHKGSSNQDSSVWREFDEDTTGLQDTRNPTAEAVMEVCAFREMARITRSSNPHMWWAHQKSSYPRLTQVMKTRLCIVATSVPSERVFSKTGQLISERRNRLSTAKVSQLAFLNFNLK
ncbi:zinc finger BED domain-containing protein 4-like [Xyrichtys novacula]|uniref:Zinc finger BED domain-containing protein 4-like n=1 Tax=Xyrichtys novacula TaxID=13765 RepID=A0AAV1FFB5_XYRNO|nr:zinc finger BED domain-containing protein 4-like [Xyrichtys novacula]